MAATAAVAAAEDARYVEPTYRLRPEPENMCDSLRGGVCCLHGGGYAAG